MITVQRYSLNFASMDRQNTLHWLMSVLLAIIATQSAFATPETTHPCSLVRAPKERLACYDAAFGKSTEQAAATPEEQFGFTAQQAERAASPEANAEAATSVSSPITAIERLRGGYFVVTLDNGQVWAQSELNSRAHVEVGDAVTVRRGVFGSYLLVTKDGIATRARRVR